MQKNLPNVLNIRKSDAAYFTEFHYEWKLSVFLSAPLLAGGSASKMYDLSA